MILGIISDSHDNLPKLKKAVTLFNKKNVSLVLHAGDYIAHLQWVCWRII